MQKHFNSKTSLLNICCSCVLMKILVSYHLFYLLLFFTFLIIFFFKQSSCCALHVVTHGMHLEMKSLHWLLLHRALLEMLVLHHGQPLSSTLWRKHWWAPVNLKSLLLISSKNQQRLTCRCWKPKNHSTNPELKILLQLQIKLNRKVIYYYFVAVYMVRSYMFFFLFTCAAVLLYWTLYVQFVFMSKNIGRLFLSMREHAGGCICIHWSHNFVIHTVDLMPLSSPFLLWDSILEDPIPSIKWHKPHDKEAEEILDIAIF